MPTLSLYILKRLLQAIPLIGFVMAINFWIIHAAPGDPVTYLYGSLAEVSAEQMHRLREQWDSPNRYISSFSATYASCCGVIWGFP